MDEEREVRTSFVADASRFIGPAMAAAGQASLLGAAVSHATGMFGMLSGAVVGAMGGLSLKSIADMHSQVESTSLALGGMLSAFGYASDFNSGMQMAEETMKAITIAAAKLPGEAEDYVAVFRAGLPAVQGAIKGTLKDAYDFTNQLTGVTSMLQIASHQVAADIPRLLDISAHAGAHNITWMRMLGYIKQIPKYADITAEKFNKMSQTARGALFKELVYGQSLGAMLKRASDTWDSATGTFASNLRMLTRESTKPLFEGMKRGLMAFNALLYDDEGEMTALSRLASGLGTVLSESLVQRVSEAVEVAQRLGSRLKEAGVVVMKSPGFGRLEALFTEMSMGGDKLAKLGSDQPLNVGGGGLQALGPLGGVLDALTRKDTLRESAGFAGDALLQLTKFIEPVLGIMATLQSIISDLVVATLPPLAFLLDAVVEPLVEFGVGLFAIGQLALNMLRPALDNLFQAVGTLTVGAGEFLHPALRILGAAVLWVAREAIVSFVSGLNSAINALASFIRFIGKFIGKDLGNSLDRWANKMLGPMQDDGASGGTLDTLKKMSEAVKKASQAAAHGRDAHNTPHARGGAKTVQDFRGSRFDITQKFEEGFDPDRVAVAFARDVARVGDQRLQSGYEPAGAV